VSPGAALPRVTVCIPTHNRAPLLRAALESALVQSFEDFSVVVADNASTDDTEDVVSSFSDPRLHYVRRPFDLGPAENIRRCLEAIDTDYVIFLLDDDLWRQTFLERSVDVLASNPHVGLVHSAFSEIAPDGTVRVEHCNWTGGPSVSSVESGETFIRESMRWSCRVFMSSALIRAAAVPGGGLDPRDGLDGDFGLWLRIALGWDVAFLAEPLASFRRHPGSLSSGEGFVVGDVYLRGFEGIARTLGVKLRLIEENLDRLTDPRSLRTLARRRGREELAAGMWASANGKRGLSPMWRALLHAAQCDPRMLIEPRAWRLLAGRVLGPRMVRALKKLERA
jgi:glycosyltransferase involved in cell wall biosynthesis